MKFNFTKIKNFLKKACCCLTATIIISMIIYLALNINQAKILSTYDDSTETIILYNGTGAPVKDVLVGVTLDCGVKINLTVPYLPAYKEEKLVISEKLPTDFEVTVTDLNVRAFKLNFANFLLMSVLILLNYIYCHIHAKYLI